MKTTLREIYKYRPCGNGFAKLIYYMTGFENYNCDTEDENVKHTFWLNIKQQFEPLSDQIKDRDIDFMEILESNGIKDTIWCLRTQEYKDYCIFLAHIAESVLPIFEKKYPEDKRPRKAIEGIRAHKRCEIIKEDLSKLAAAAYASADASASASAADAANVAATAADANVAADAAAYAAASKEKKWKEIEQLFVKHYGGRR